MAAKSSMPDRMTLHGSGLTLVTPDLWTRRLAGTRTAEEVLRVARDFIASWHPLDIAALPDRCWPQRMRDADDINVYAFELVNANFQLAGEYPGIEYMCTFFSAAAARLSEILASERTAQDEGDERAGNSAA